MDGTNSVAAPLDIDPRQRYFTTVQPFSYRDTLTVLGYVQEIAAHLDALREQLDNLGEDEQADVSNILSRIGTLTKELGALTDTVNAMADKVDEYKPSTLVYNPTVGRDMDSRNAMRDIYRELAVFGARVNQMAALTCEQAAGHSNIEFAVVGNKTIFGNDQPRTTPR